MHGMLRSHALRTVTFSLGGETVAALLDTGAERSGMSIDAADRCGLRALIDGSFSRTVRGVGTAQGLGRVQYAEISFNGVPFHAAFDVMRWPESAVDFEAILGLDLLVRARAMIDISGSQVDLTNQCRHDEERASKSMARGGLRLWHSVPATRTAERLRQP